MTEALLLAVTPVSTYQGSRLLTRASAFFFQRDQRLYLVTSAHVFRDDKADHEPDRIEFDVHLDRVDLTRMTSFSILLYDRGRATWRQAADAGGPIDVAVLAIDRSMLSVTQAYECFTPDHLQAQLQDVEVGSPILVVGFPLGFHDTVHHLPVVRQAGIASSFGVRFQGKGFFLTDARTHRGMSGAPVVMHAAAPDGPLAWRLLGVHSARMDMGTRDRDQDEGLGLNCAWYADVLMALTADPPSQAAAPPPGGQILSTADAPAQS